MNFSRKQVEFVASIMQMKIKRAHSKVTPACIILSKTIDVSHLTLIKASRGEFTMRTVRKMVEAKWFSMEEFHSAGAKTKAKTEKKSPLPDTSNFEKTFKGLIQESYRRGYEDGVHVSTKNKKSDEDWFQEGYNAGYKDGQTEAAVQYRKREQARQEDKRLFEKGREAGRQEGYAKGYKAGKAVSKADCALNEILSIPNVKLGSVLNLYSRPATPGEKAAAQRAAGVIISNWIRKEYGHEFQVNVM